MNKRTTARRKAAARPAVDLERHERICTVCSHPEREAIEEAFLHWRTLTDLEGERDLPSPDSIFRHAHALGLFERRSRNFRYALENIIEGSESAPATADSVIRAIRACACLKANGQWVDPPTTHRVIVSVTRGDAHAPIPVLSLPASSLEGLPNNNSESLELSASPLNRKDNLKNARENDRENHPVPTTSTRNRGKIENAATH